MLRTGMAYDMSPQKGCYTATLVAVGEHSALGVIFLCLACLSLTSPAFSLQQFPPLSSNSSPEQRFGTVPSLEKLS